ncbi:MAG: DUF3316 domain-containing protein [Sphingobacteriia bacterium]|nr:DUF3316 domain-containing protein [Sphingobacteriia bacterium]
MGSGCEYETYANSYTKMKVKLLLALLIPSALLFAEMPTSLLNNYWTLSSGFVTFDDAYLSNLEYKGWGVQWEAFHCNLYKNNDKLSWQNKNTFFFASTNNPPYSANIMNLNITLAFGTHYHFKPDSHFSILVGGFWDIDGGLKYHNRNINNIASADLSTNLSASAMFRYHLITEKLQMAFEYDLQTPVIGCMFVPEMGVSYYEYYLFQNLHNAIHFSSFHNKLGLKGNLSIDFIFKKFTFRAGFTHNNLIWYANNLYFKKEQYMFTIGTVVNMTLFGGKNSNSNDHTSIWK